MGCSSAGLMCSIAAAHPDKYLTLPAQSLQLPSEVVEFDMRGRMDAAKGGDYAYIDVGEVKSSAHYTKSVEQLGLRLGLLRWLVHVCAGIAVPDIRLVGRLFLPKAALQGSFIEDQEREKALHEWGFSLYVHDFQGSAACRTTIELFEYSGWKAVPLEHTLHTVPSGFAQSQSYQCHMASCWSACAK